MNLPFFKRASASAVRTLVPDPVTIEHEAVAPVIDLSAEFEAFKVSAISEIEALKAQAAAYLAERDSANKRAELAEAAAAKTREEITAEVRNHEVANIAASQGVPPEAIVPAQMENAPMTKEEKIQDLQKRLAAASDPAERYKIGVETRKALFGK